MEEKTLLDARIHEVIRTLPLQQAAEIRRYDNGLYWAACGQESQIVDYRRSRNSEPKYRRIVPELVRKMAWQDLEIADLQGFPALSPRRAMRIGRTATEIAGRFASIMNDPRFDCMPHAVNLVGLHTSILGSDEVLDSEIAQHNLAATEQAYTEEFISFIARVNANNRSNR